MDFGELRSLLSQAPSAALWARLWRMMEGVEPTRQGELVPYVSGHLERWPDALRVAPEHWSQRALYGEDVPLWPLVRSASLSRWGLYDTEMIALARSEAMEQLTCLELSHNQLGEDGLRAVASSPRCERLRSLNVRDNPLGPSGVRGLAQVEGLEAVELGWTRCAVRGMRHLLRGKSAGNLRVLAAVHNSLGDEALSPLQRMERLEVLELGSNRLTAGAAQVLAQAELPALRALDLSENALGDEGARWVATLMLRCPLTRLTLAACGLGAPGLRALLSTPRAAQLESLDLSRNRIGLEAGRQLLESSHMVRLERLVLEACGLGPAEVAALAEAPHLSSLRELDLSHNPIGVNGALALATSPHLGGLDRLVVEDASIGAEGVSALLQSPHAACRAAVDLQRRWAR